jgi:hypothetical protein
MILEVTVGPLLHIEHVLETHTKCQRSNCMVCDGGLSICTVCGGFEGSLLDSCPGVKLTPEQHEWNYKRWCELPAPQLTKIYEGAGL